MTNQTIPSRAPAQKFLRVFPALAVLFCMLFLLRNPAAAKDAVQIGLHRAATGVLPSVFPFLVLSDLLTSVGGLPARMSRCRPGSAMPSSASRVC